MNKLTKFLSNNYTLIIVMLIVTFVIWWYYRSSSEGFFSTPSNKKIIYFYSNSCKFCSSFDPIWSLFVNNVDSSCIALYKVNIDNTYYGRYNVASVPTILAVKDSYAIKMPGPKTYENLINFYTQFRAI